MPEELQTRIIETVARILRENSTSSAVILVDPSSSMDNTGEWDSMNFIHVFLGLTQELGIDAETDDAVHFTSIANILAFVERQLEISKSDQ